MFPELRGPAFESFSGFELFGERPFGGMGSQRGIHLGKDIHRNLDSEKPEKMNPLPLRLEVNAKKVNSLCSSRNPRSGKTFPHLIHTTKRSQILAPTWHRRNNYGMGLGMPTTYESAYEVQILLSAPTLFLANSRISQQNGLNLPNRYRTIPDTSGHFYPCFWHQWHQMKKPAPPREVIKWGEKRWLVDLRNFGGGRQYFKDEASAQRSWSAAIKDQAAFGRLAFDLPHETRTRYLSLETRATEAGTTLEAALDYWIRQHGGAAEPKPLSQAIQECVAAKTAAGRRRRSVQQLGYALNSLLEHFDGSDPQCNEIDLGDVEEWLDNPEWSLGTRKGRLTDARTFFRFCLKRGWIGSDPTLAVEPITLDEGPPGLLTVEQAKRLLEATRKHRARFLPFVVLGLFAGVRPEEIKQLSWQEVNLYTGYVEIPAYIAKRVRGGGRQRRLIKLQPNAIAWLKLKGDLPPVSWQDSWDAVRKAAGFRVSIKQSGRRVHTTKGEPWPRNAMRHSFCSYCLPVFGEIDESRWAGHSPEVAHSRYDGKVTKEDATRFWSIFPSASAPKTIAQRKP